MVSSFEQHLVSRRPSSATPVVSVNPVLRELWADKRIVTQQLGHAWSQADRASFSGNETDEMTADCLSLLDEYVTICRRIVELQQCP